MLSRALSACAAQARRLFTTAAVLAAACAPWQSANAVLLYDISASGGGSTFTNAGNWGFQFTLSSSTTVASLGLWDEGKNGLASSHQVGLYNNGNGQLMASATVTSSSIEVASTNSNGRWLFTDLAAPITLPGGTYVLSYFNPSSGPDAFRGNTATGVFMSGAAYQTGRARGQDTVFKLPFNDSGAVGGWYAANFSTTALAAAPVPEPQTWLLMAGGLAAVVLRRQRVRRVS